MKKLSSVFLSALLTMGIVLQSTSVVFAAPHEVYGRIIVNSADYFLEVDHDEYGNARVFPSKTTFSQSDAVSGATKPANRFTLRTNQGENAIYSYAPERLSQYKTWAENITRITSLSYDWENIIRYVPADLSYEETDEGLILKTKGLDSGIYTIRIYSKGSDTFVLNLEVQQEAPTIKLSSGASYAKANASASFSLNGMGFTWRPAIYEVYLNGEVLDAEQYTTVSNLITLSEGVLSKIGENTLTVKSYGYKDASFAFAVQAVSPVVNAGQVMAISSASSSGGGGDVDGTSGASGTVPAFLVFNFDMLANAQILEHHNMGTEASKKILDFWDEANKEVLRGAGMDLYDWDTYIESGKSFEDHVAEGGARASAADGLFWDMWEVKYVLENGKLGDPYDFYEQIAEPHPVLKSADADWKEGIVLNFSDASDEDFAKWVQGIKIHEQEVLTNAAAVKVDGTGLYASEYKIDTDQKQFILPPATLNSRVSANSTLVIRSSGYKTIDHKIDFATGTYIPVLGAEQYYVGDTVEIKGIPSNLREPNVLKGSEALWYGSSAGPSNYFTVEQDGEDTSKIVIRAANFTEAGTYDIKIKSTNYATQTIKVKIMDDANKPNYSIGTISDVIFDQLTVGYTEPAATTVAITNTGNQTLTELTASLTKGDESDFILGTFDNSTLEIGASAELVIAPKEGLAEGTYSDTVTISTTGLTSKTITVTQKVVSEIDDGNEPEEPLGENEYRLGSDITLDVSNIYTAMGEPSFTIKIGGDTIPTNRYTYNGKTKELTLDNSVFAETGSYSIHITATYIMGQLDASYNIKIK